MFLVKRLIHLPDHPPPNRQPIARNEPPEATQAIRILYRRGTEGTEEYPVDLSVPSVFLLFKPFRRIAQSAYGKIAAKASTSGEADNGLGRCIRSSSKPTD